MIETQCYWCAAIDSTSLMCADCLTVVCNKCAEKVCPRCGSNELQATSFAAGEVCVKLASRTVYEGKKCDELAKIGLAEIKPPWMLMATPPDKFSGLVNKQEEIRAKQAFKSSLKLKLFQETAVKQLIRQKRGIVVSLPGTGKTIMALAVASALQQKTLFVCPTTQIADQTVEKAKRFLGIEAKRWYGKYEEDGDFIVTLFQKMVRETRTPKHGLIIVDEVHHSVCESMRKILSKSRAAFRYGFTATLHHNDFPLAAFENLFSPHIIEVDAQRAREEKVLADGVVVVHNTGLGADIEEKCCEKYCTLHPRPSKCEECPLLEARLSVFMEGWVDNSQRNGFVADRILEKQQEGCSTILVLVRRIEHADNLAKVLSLDGAQVMVAHGRLPKERRRKIIDKFDKEGGILIATESLLGEGTDIVNCDCVVPVCPAKGKKRGKQRAGRAMRYSEGKSFQIIEFVDNFKFAKILWWSRRREYAKMGLEIVYADHKETNRSPTI